MDPEQIKLLTEELQRLQQTLEEGFVRMQSKARQAKDDGERAVRDIGDAWTRQLEDGGNELMDVSRTWGEAIQGVMKNALMGPLILAQNTIKQYKQEVNALASAFDQRALRGADKAGGFFTGLQRLNSTVFANLPFGGILGVMLFGRMQEAQFFAKAQQAAQVIQRSGSMGRQMVQQLTTDIRTLEQSIPGISSNFASSNAMLAELGFTGRDATQAITQGLEGARDTVLNLSVAMDRFFELGAGEAMKFSATIAQNTNAALKDAVQLVRDIGLSVQDTGVSFTSMLGTIMQVTSALRLQTNELKEAEGVAVMIQRAQAGFRAAGISSPERAGAIATAGLQGIAGALSGMQVGLQAVLGERMTGGRAQGLQAIMEFEQGFRGRGENQQFFVRSIEEIIKLSDEIGKGDPARQYQVLKSLFGLNAEQAQTLMAIQRSSQEGLPIEQAAAKNMDALNKSFRDEALKQDLFRTLTNRLIQVVAKLGSSLLDVIVSGLESLIASITYLTKYLTMGTTTSEDAAYTQYVSRTGARAGRAFQTAFDQLFETAEIADLFGKQVLGRSEDDAKVAGRFYRELFVRPERPEQRGGLMSDMWGTRKEPQRRGGYGVTGSWSVDMDADVPPGGGKMTGTMKLRPVAPPTSEPQW